jgi:hypothetical protein
MMYLEMRKPTGDPNVRCLNLHHGINITNRFMAIIERCMQDADADDGWNLETRIQVRFAILYLQEHSGKKFRAKNGDR